MAAIRLLAFGPWGEVASPLQALLKPQNSSEIQLAAVRALANHDDPKVGEVLLSAWDGYSPRIRREVLEAMLARLDRVSQLLDAIEAKKVPAGQLEPSRLDQLRKHPNANIRQRAENLLAGSASPDRRKVLDDYRPALTLKSDSVRGKAIFKKVCSTCHRLENEGVEVDRKSVV